MKTSNITIIIYKEGSSDHGYKFVIQNGCQSWTAERTQKGFDYFMKNYGLELDTETAQPFDNYNRLGRIKGTTYKAKAHEVETVLFWNMEDVPKGATQFIGMENGSYVNQYAHIEEGKTTIYSPNANAKNVYIPYDHKTVSEQIYGVKYNQ